MIELRKMENRKFRTFGWVQDPSDFKSLYNVVAIFDNTSEVHKQLVDERIEKLIEEKENSIKLKFLHEKITILTVMDEISKYCEIEDVHMKEAELEDILKEIYKGAHKC